MGCKRQVCEIKGAGAKKGVRCCPLAGALPRYIAPFSGSGGRVSEKRWSLWGFLFMVGLPVRNLKGAKELFEQDDARQAVGEGHLGKRDEPCGVTL